MMKFFRLSAAFALFVTVMATVPACNTVGGAGKDAENLGEKVQDAAD